MSTKKNYYIDGNTVRKLEAAPKRVPRQPRITEEDRKKQRRKNAVRRNRARNMSMDLGSVIFLTICSILCVVAATAIIKLQSLSTMHLKQIANLESQINDLSNENAETQKRINIAVDLDVVRDIAINQLGMTYATEEQIVYYSVDRTNYMDQYDDIPEN